MSAGRLLVSALRDPDSLADPDWSALIAAARAEQLLGSLAERLRNHALPRKTTQILAAARRESAHQRTRALWEAEMARRALAPLGVPVVLLKGTAFHAANLTAAAGRSVGDLDILVPRERMAQVEAALLAAGWERMKEADGYDDLYHRRWMHELPPLIHRDRDRMIDVHHTILPPTARPTPDARALIADSVALESGLRILAPADMVIHAAAHLFADGDQYTFMDEESYEQITVNRDMIGDPADFLTDGMKVSMQFIEGQVVGVELPQNSVGTVVEADAVVKGQTASSSYKPAKLDNGARVMVPPFITVGERIVVNIHERTYVERAKD